MSTVAAHRHSPTTSSTPHTSDFAARLRRSLKFTLPPALFIGLALGVWEANPSWLVLWLPRGMQPSDAALIAMALMGLICGLLAGFTLRGAAFLVRLGIAVLTVLVGWSVFVLTRGFLVSVILHNALISVGDVQTIAQPGLGILAALIGVLPGQIARPQPAAPARRRAARRRASGQAVPRQRSANARANGHVKIEAPPRPSPRQGKKRRQTVHLGKSVIQVCPYCLEEVKPHDPRGRVVCKICHTAHHADCWAIAGRCQVPHLQP